MYTVVKWTLVADHLGARRSARTRRAPPSTRRRPLKRGVLVCTPIDDTLMMWPRLALAHAGQERHDQLQRAEVVQLHRALVVVEAVVRGLQRAPDRASGVVDQDVDAAVLVEDLLRHPVDVLQVGQVGRVHVCRAAALLDLLGDLLELLARARDEDDLAARLADLERRRAAPMPLEAPVIDDLLAIDGLASASARGTGRGRGCAPSSPTACGRTCRAAAPRCRCPRSARWVSRASKSASEVAVLERGRRDPEVAAGPGGGCA